MCLILNQTIVILYPLKIAQVYQNKCQPFKDVFKGENIPKTIPRVSKNDLASFRGGGEQFQVFCTIYK